MGYKFLVIGAGRQGTAAAYDLAKHSDTEKVIVADAVKDRTEAACARVKFSCWKIRCCC
jgi:lysine 6-dehydrogenase